MNMDAYGARNVAQGTQKVLDYNRSAWKIIVLEQLFPTEKESAGVEPAPFLFSGKALNYKMTGSTGVPEIRFIPCPVSSNML